MSHPDLRIRTLPAMSAIAAPEWDACANPGEPAPILGGVEGPARSGETSLEPHLPASVRQQRCEAPASSESRTLAYNPFLSHAFLHALEISGSATARTGWLPQHLVAETAAGAVIGVAPCYLKSHSRGEYVFDHSWADAYDRAGGRYYPKLQACVPFTPATGRRLLARREDRYCDVPRIQAALAMGLVELCRTLDSSSVHVTFATEREWELLGGHGFLQRTDQQFHWHNAGYGSFQDFLAALSARKRKAIRRERRDALLCGIDVQWLTGSDLTEAVWDDFFAFYMETGSRKWGRPYLTRTFYSLIGEAMADRILLVMAKRSNRFIAGAINFIGSDALYGRHWGAVEHHPFLHFELCYYQAIEFAIAHRLARVEAGVQGEHKLARGYLPVVTHSAHHIADPRLRRAIADYLQHERAYVAAAGRELAEAAPFRKNLSLDSVVGQPEPR